MPINRENFVIEKSKSDSHKKALRLELISFFRKNSNIAYTFEDLMELKMVKNSEDDIVVILTLWEQGFLERKEIDRKCFYLVNEKVKA